jgi:drug/metabolite transporter (DMT)-like permease
VLVGGEKLTGSIIAGAASILLGIVWVVRTRAPEAT